MHKPTLRILGPASGQPRKRVIGFYSVQLYFRNCFSQSIFDEVVPRLDASRKCALANGAMWGAVTAREDAPALPVRRVALLYSHFTK